MLRVSSTALPNYLQLPEDRDGHARIGVDSATAIGPSLDEELFPPLRLEGDLNGDIDSMNRELRMVAALEASVYLARSGKGGATKRVKAKAVHAPARRLARTTISLGPEEGITFGLRAIRAIQAAADGSTDVVGMAFWWSNCIQLRWMLWAMCHGGGADNDYDELDDPDSPSGEDTFDWVMKVLVPPLRQLESYIFNQIFAYLWRVMTDYAASEAAGVPPGRPPLHPPSREEAAVNRWLDALQLVRNTIVPASTTVTAGHLALLKTKILTSLMRRLDSSLFNKLMEDAEDVRKQNSFSPAWRGNAPVSAATRTGSEELSTDDMDMDQRLLPFRCGPMSFTTGVNLKLAVTRWSNWSADVGIRDEKKGDEGYMLFPRLRSTADLLMMPKEVLTDRAIRAEVVPGLSLRIICHVLGRFHPDDLASDPLPPGLLEALHSESPIAEDSPTASDLLGPVYEPPTESSLLQDGLIEPVSLEMDEESEDEVEKLSEMYDQENGGEGTHRFELLRELWASAG